MYKKYKIEIRVKIKNKKEVKKAYKLLKKRKEITIDDIFSLPIVWDIKTKII